jgi:hypothetical protein
VEHRHARQFRQHGGDKKDSFQHSYLLFQLPFTLGGSSG